MLPFQLRPDILAAVQLKHFFADSKTWVDAIPLRSDAEITQLYAQQSSNPSFSLRIFIANNFRLPEGTDWSTGAGFYVCANPFDFSLYRNCLIYVEHYPSAPGTALKDVAPSRLFYINSAGVHEDIPILDGILFKYTLQEIVGNAAYKPVTREQMDRLREAATTSVPHIRSAVAPHSQSVSNTQSASHPRSASQRKSLADSATRLPTTPLRKPALLSESPFSPAPRPLSLYQAQLASPNLSPELFKQQMQALRSRYAPAKEYIEGIWGTLHRRGTHDAAFSSVIGRDSASIAGGSGPSSAATPNMGTLIPLRQDSVVPGARFRESYYWDTYFTAVGLAAAGRFALIRDMIANFIDLIEDHDHIPNGNRQYYLSRSQPPVFACLLDLYFKGPQARGQYYQPEQDLFYWRAMAALKKEYEYWTDPVNGSAVELLNGDILNRYNDPLNTPRPEAYCEDVALFRQAYPEQNPFAPRDNRFYRHIRAAAASGWDFSTRWFAGGNLENIHTLDIIPVDLNGLLYMAEKFLGEHLREPSYLIKAEARQKAIDRYLWDPVQRFYFDADHMKIRQGETGRTSVYSLAGCVPLFAGIASIEQAADVALRLEQGFLRPGGLVATMNYRLDTQWDSPNGWAPLQYLAVTGLRRYQQHELAQEIMRRWLDRNAGYFNKHGQMMEKYDVCVAAHEMAYARGGEYPVQGGFGWTNGVFLEFAARLEADLIYQQQQRAGMEMFTSPWEDVSPHDCATAVRSTSRHFVGPTATRSAASVVVVPTQAPTQFTAAIRSVLSTRPACM